jgi:hypothetical protein
MAASPEPPSSSSKSASSKSTSTAPASLGREDNPIEVSDSDKSTPNKLAATSSQESRVDMSDHENSTPDGPAASNAENQEGSAVKKDDIPGPLTELDLDMSQFELPNNVDFFESKACGDMYQDADADLDSMFKNTFWNKVLHEQAQKSKYDALVKGFWVVEDVVFRRHPNTGSESNCYWYSLALLLYGDYNYWLRVKAEHLEYFGRVLRDEKHPRHDFHASLNERKLDIQFRTKDGYKEEPLNLWQVLHIPKAWVPMLMTHITSDLYKLYMVVFTTDRIPKGKTPKVGHVAIRGSYNSRHVFLSFVVCNSVLQEN